MKTKTQISSMARLATPIHKALKLQALKAQSYGTILLILFITLAAGANVIHAQQKNDNVICVHGISFAKVTDIILSSGYELEMVNKEIGYISTKLQVHGTNGMSMLYRIAIIVRIKDSIACITGKFDVPDVVQQRWIVYKPGVLYHNGWQDLAFHQLDQFARSLLISPENKITYAKQ